MKNKNRPVDWFRRQPAWWYVTAGFAVIAVIGWLDFVVVKAMSLFTMYTAPVVWLVWFTNTLTGYTGALLAGALLFVDDRVSATHAGHVFIPYWNVGLQLILLLSFAWLIDHLKQALIREEGAKRHEFVRELEIAGDFYDVLSPAPGLVGWVIGDASGRGLPASFLMTSLVGALRTRTSAMRDNLCQTLGALNQFLFKMRREPRGGRIWRKFEFCLPTTTS